MAEFVSQPVGGSHITSVMCVHSVALNLGGNPSPVTLQPPSNRPVWRHSISDHTLLKQVIDISTSYFMLIFALWFLDCLKNRNRLVGLCNQA